MQPPEPVLHLLQPLIEEAAEELRSRRITIKLHPQGSTVEQHGGLNALEAAQ